MPPFICFQFAVPAGSTITAVMEMHRMSLSLVIAEKPSVAGDIARALGGFTRDGDFWVRDDMVIGSAVGHLLEITAPEEFDVKRGRWTFKNLPVLPPYFDLKPIKKSEEKLKALSKKIRSRAVTEVINACDAGREGELIFRYIMQSCGSKKPVKRLWLQSMTKNAIQEGFRHLRTDDEMKPLEAAARCRSEADWLVGINGTRAMTAFNSKEGGFFLTTVGRVQTPTLAIVVKREEEINAFVPKGYWEVSAVFGVSAGEYEGIWIDPNFRKDKDDPDRKAERLWTEDEARRIAAACRNGMGKIEETSKRSRQLSPLLFDLTSLQREANSRFGYSAKTTLSIAQALYEKHKVLTYPRTDARALPEDYMPTVRDTLNALGGLTDYAAFSSKILTQNWVRPDKRIFDNTKISDHFAIIPTGQLPKTLNEVEQKIFDLVVRRFLAVFYPAAEYDVTVRITTVGAHQFKTEGKVLAELGWLEVAGKGRTQREALTPVKPGEPAAVKDVVVSTMQTKAPARYTEATLLSAMETAGKKLEDDELRGAMADKGLGTPATRASIIEGLIEQKYMRREERDLHPMAKAFQLITLLKGLKIAELSEPRLTAEWEQKLRLIEEGKFQSDEFMREIRRLTENVVNMAKQYEGNSVPLENPRRIEAPCPQCGGEIVENYRRFACTTPGCEFSIAKHPSGRMLEQAEVEELLNTGRVGPLSGFISKRGFPFEAELILKKDETDGLWKMQFDFGEEEKAEVTDEEIESAPVVGVCPCCGARVLEMPAAYQCEKNIRGEKKCTFRISKTILSRDITSEEVTELLANKRTQLLSGFISKKSKRAFKAFLIVKGNGSIAFEFQPSKKDAEATESGEENSEAKPRKTTRRTTKKKTAAE